MDFSGFTRKCEKIEYKLKFRNVIFNMYSEISIESVQYGDQNFLGFMNWKYGMILAF